MTTPNHIAVIDIGKTNAKLALVDLETVTELVVVTRPNTVLSGPPWPHFDVDGHWAFLLDALRQFHIDYGIDAISVTTHGASIVLLQDDGKLAAPILDYEYDGPDRFAEAYDKIRPDFTQSGSPKLAGGLNVGAQLYWQFATDPQLKDRTAHIVTYPQYWGHGLTGVVASDVTSIGCHTDLWLPYNDTFSDLPAKLGIAEKFAPVRKSMDILGPITQKIATITGLPLDTNVCVGIHDSNASLYPYILNQTGAFSVVSTGTWVVVMSMAGAAISLDPNRDTLVNVNAYGQAVPSARFMGGREYEIIQAGQDVRPSQDDVEKVLMSSQMLLPSVDPLTGPYQGENAFWSGGEPLVGAGQRAAALSFYLAMMTDTCLRLTGAEGPTIVEGPFANNALFVSMLAVATGRPVLKSQAETGTSIGAALLFAKHKELATPSPVPLPLDVTQWQRYSAQWHWLVQERRQATV